jgi:ferric-dicitrate binding protein FerR (iron transport regulator)
MSYHTGLLDFSNNSLKEVVEDLNQYQTNYTIQIANADVNNCLITTSFKNEKIEDILKVITSTLQLTYRKDEEKKLITIEGAYCK